MNEENWFNASDVYQMQCFVANQISGRKRRLFACACCRVIWDLLNDPQVRKAVEIAEAFADGNALQEQLIPLQERCGTIEPGFPLCSDFVYQTCYGDAAGCDAVAEGARYHEHYHRENPILDEFGRDELSDFLQMAWSDGAHWIPMSNKQFFSVTSSATPSAPLPSTHAGSPPPSATSPKPSIESAPSTACRSWPTP